MSKHFIQLLVLLCLFSVFVSCFPSGKSYFMIEWFQNSTCINWKILFPSLYFMCLPSACLGGSKPNPRDDVQYVQSTQGASYTCTVLPIISETVQTFKAIGNKPTHRACWSTLYGMTCSQSRNTTHICPRFSFEVLHSCCTTSLAGHSCCWRVDEVTVTKQS